MVDNIDVTPGTGKTVAADDVSGALYQRVKLAYGADGAATDANLTSPYPGTTPGGLQTVPSTQFARPADGVAYTIGDLVANSTTAGSVTGVVFPNAVRVAGESIRIERLRLRKSTTTLLAASFRVYICRALPTLSVGDNVAFNVASVLGMDSIQYVVGWFDITMDRAATAGARGVGVPNTGAAITIAPSSGTTLYGLIEALGAYAPGNAETWDATLEGQWS